MVNDPRHQLESDHVFVSQVAGGSDLVHLPRNVRVARSGIDSLAAAEAILVAVVLIGGAFRHGTPPVNLWLRFDAGRRRLRIETHDHQPFSSVSHGCRARLLDRLASEWGLEPTENGGTKAWVELPVLPMIKQVNAEQHELVVDVAANCQRSQGVSDTGGTWSRR